MRQKLMRRHEADGCQKQVAIEGDGRSVDLAGRIERSRYDAAYMPVAALGNRLPSGEALEHANAMVAHGIGDGAAPRLLLQVEHSPYLDPSGNQVDRGGVAVRVRGRDDCALTGADAELADEALRGRGEHDPRQVVVAENERLLDGAGGKHHLFGAHLVKAIALDDRQPVVVEEAGNDRPGHHLDAGLRRNLIPKCGEGRGGRRAPSTSKRA